MRRTFRSFVTALVVCLGFVGIVNAQIAVRVETDSIGMHRIAGEALEQLLSLDSLHPDRLGLRRDGKLVPVFIPGAADGRIDRGDEILFYADPPSDPRLRTATYILSEMSSPPRYSLGTLPNDLERVAFETRISVNLGSPRAFESWAAVNPKEALAHSLPRWGIAAIVPARGKDETARSKASLIAVLDPRPIKASPGRLSLRVAGALVGGVPQRLAIRVNGTTLPEVTWTDPFMKDLDIPLPGDLLDPRLAIEVTNLSPMTTVPDKGNDMRPSRTNRLVIERATVSYLTQLTGPSVTSAQTNVEIVPPVEAVPFRRLPITMRQSEGYIVFDPDSAKLWRTSDVVIRGDRSARLSILAANGAKDPVSLNLAKPLVLRPGDEGADWVAITTDSLRPGVEALASHRRTRGMKTFVVSIRTLHDTYSAGKVDPESIRSFLIAASAAWKTKPKYVLLAGDAQLDGDVTASRETLPTLFVPTAYNGWTAADPLLGDINADGWPDIAVGRIPARAPEDFSRVLGRIMTLETKPEMGSWKRDALFVGIPADFGPAQDAMIEQVAIDTISESVPPWMHIDATYGSPNSPWFWPEQDFLSRFVRRYEAGALIVTYAGHGSEGSLDTLKVGSARFPFVSKADLGKLGRSNRTGAVVLLACSAGRHDDPADDCLSESWFLGEGGPMLMIAASRVSHPVANALLGRSMSAELGRPSTTIGSSWLATLAGLKGSISSPLASVAQPFMSKAVSLESLLRDHAALYHLFGDPGATLPVPAVLERATVSGTVKAGGTVTVTFPMPAGDEWLATVTFERTRREAARSHTPAIPTDMPESGPASRRSASDIAATHSKANAVVLTSATVQGAGEPTVILRVPPETLPGLHYVSVFVDSPLGARIALLPVVVE